VRDRSPRARASLAVAAVVLANLLLLDHTARPDAQGLVAGARLALTVVALAAGLPVLLRRALPFLRRGLLVRDALACVGAALAFGTGLGELALARSGARAVPDALITLGLRPACWPPVRFSGLEVAVGIVATALAAHVARDLVTAPAERFLSTHAGSNLRHVFRLCAHEEMPVEGSWEEAALRGLFTAALGFASFALVTHGWLGGGPLAAPAVLAAVAVLVGFSPSALLAAAPVARAVALVRASRDGKDVRSGSFHRHPVGVALERVLRQNLVIGAVYNAAVVPAAAVGLLAPLPAALLMLLETLLVLGNAARLARV
jgi:cation transport ATPase